MGQQSFRTLCCEQNQDDIFEGEYYQRISTKSLEDNQVWKRKYYLSVDEKNGWSKYEIKPSDVIDRDIIFELRRKRGEEGSKEYVHKNYKTYAIIKSLGSEKVTLELREKYWDEKEVSDESPSVGGSGSSFMDAAFTLKFTDTEFPWPSRTLGHGKSVMLGSNEMTPLE